MKTHMKSLLLIALLLFCSILFASATFNFNCPSKIEIYEIQAEDGNIYNRVLINGIMNTGQPGEPELPVKYVNLIIPSDQTAINVIMYSSVTEEYQLKKLILPAQQDHPTTDIEVTIPFAPPKAEIYQSDKLYPEHSIQIVKHNWFDGNKHIVTLAIYPVQYFPKDNKIIMITEIVYGLEYAAGAKGSIDHNRRNAKHNDFYDGVLTKMVDNPDDVPIYSVSEGLPKMSGGPVPFYEYVVITPNVFKESFKKLINWKKRKGWDAGIVPVEEILSHYSTDHISGISDDAGAIRQYLFDAYTSGITVFALMGGDYNYVPIRYGCGTHDTWDYHYSDGIIYDAYKIPADLYFCDFNGDWDVDGTDLDGVIRYGEPFSSTPNYGDNPDYGPEIFVGRLLCSSVDDIINWSEKLILYEQNPGKGDHSYLTRSFMIQSDELQDGNQAGEVDSHLPSAFQPSQIWGEIPSGGAEHPTFPFGYEVINEMNSTRYGLWSWFGHGSPIATVCKSHLYNKDIPTKSYLRAWDDLDIPPAAIEAGNGMDNLNNSSHPAVVYSIACDNTPFDDYHTNYGQRNLGEAFTSMFSGGGPAFLGNTRFGWVGSSYKVYQKFADLLSSGGFNLHLGVAEAVSRYNNSAMKHYLSYSHNLVGCPETKLWTDQPSVYANVSVTDGGTYLTVNTGVAGSTISVCSMDNGQTYSLVADNVSSYTFTTGVRPLYITVTKSNYIPFKAVTGGTITVDVSLYGELLVLGNLTVQNGCTLWVDEGANIAVSENARFTVHGALEVNGTSTNPVIFTSAKGQPSQSDWYGIEITGTASMKYATVEYSDKGIYFNSGSSGTVDHCTAQNNYWGVCVNSANAIIKNSTFTNNRTGIRVYYSYSNPSGSAKHIYDNTIGSNETYGIACYSSAPTFSGNMISGNTRGVYLSSSNCILDHSSMINSNYYGLGCFGTSSPNLYHDGESFGGFNVVTGNGIGGVRIYNSANPYLGFNSSQEPGMNSIYNNNGYEVDNMTSNTIYAAGNWWNNPVSPYGPAPSEINGSVIWSPALSYDPNGGSMLAKSAGGHDVDDESTDIPESLQLAYQDQAKGNYEKAAEAFMEYFLTNYNDPFNEQAAIQYLKSLSYYRTAIEMISDVNQSLKQDIDTDTRFELLFGRSILEIYEGTAEKAVVTLEEAEKAEINKDKQNRINYHKGMIYGYSLNNKSEAENYFTQVVENTAVESEEHFSALDEIDGLRKSAYDGQEATEEPMVISLPLTYNLTQNFPNPFGESHPLGVTL